MCGIERVKAPADISDENLNCNSVRWLTSEKTDYSDYSMGLEGNRVKVTEGYGVKCLSCKMWSVQPVRRNPVVHPYVWELSSFILLFCDSWDYTEGIGDNEIER